jgi:hypothetical protein
VSEQSTIVHACQDKGIAEKVQEERQNVQLA